MIVRHRNDAMTPAFFATCAIWLLLTFATDALAQEELLSKTGQAGQPVLVREHAGWNRNCEAIPHPALYLSEPPHHGKVCARVESIKVSSMFVGTESQCIGRLVRGVSLIYRPYGAYAGDDSLQYVARYPSVSRTIQVQVTLLANAAGATASNMVTSWEQVRQMPGPVPLCAEQIF